MRRGMTDVMPGSNSMNRRSPCARTRGWLPHPSSGTMSGRGFEGPLRLARVAEGTSLGRDVVPVPEPLARRRRGVDAGRVGDGALRRGVRAGRPERPGRRRRDHRHDGAGRAGLRDRGRLPEPRKDRRHGGVPREQPPRRGARTRRCRSGGRGRGGLAAAPRGFRRGTAAEGLPRGRPGRYRRDPGGAPLDLRREGLPPDEHHPDDPRLPVRLRVLLGDLLLRTQVQEAPRGGRSRRASADAEGGVVRLLRRRQHRRRPNLFPEPLSRNDRDGTEVALPRLSGSGRGPRAPRGGGEVGVYRALRRLRDARRGRPTSTRRSRFATTASASSARSSSAGTATGRTSSRRSSGSARRRTSRRGSSRS